VLVANILRCSPKVEKVKAMMDENISIAIENLESAEQLVCTPCLRLLSAAAKCTHHIQEEKTQQLEAGSQILQTASVAVKNRECLKSAKVCWSRLRDPPCCT